MDKLKLFSRWAVMMPAAILIAWLTFIISQAVGSFILSMIGVDSTSFLFLAYKHSMPHILMGGVFVASVIKLAPSHKNIAAYVCSFLAILLGLIPLVLAVIFADNSALNFWGIAGMVFELTGVVLMAYAVRSSSYDLREG
tara:strand:+ start:1340 stop:1759 length:420 start_codon:yes stop_codon:yes gene_type:complete